MSTCRYYTHVICVAYDQPRVMDSLALFLQNRAFLTYEIDSQWPQALAYSRQCIEACDDIILVIGDSYGTPKSNGVSQMHLAYLSAKVKLKPMLVLIKTHAQNSNVNRPLQDFIRLVEQQSKRVYYYDTHTNIEQLLLSANHDREQDYRVKPSWVRETIASAALSDDNQRLNSQKILNRSLAVDANLVQTQLSNKTSSASSGYKTDDGHKNSTNIKTLQPKNFDNNKDVDAQLSPITLEEALTIEYSAQAYAAGNLSDVTMTMTLQWQDIIAALTRIPASFTNYGLQRCLNRFIAPLAERDIKKLMPNVHAVARCQISQNDLAKIQRLLVTENWIQLVAKKSPGNLTQELWELTFYAQNYLKNGKNKI